MSGKKEKSYIINIRGITPELRANMAKSTIIDRYHGLVKSQNEWILRAIAEKSALTLKKRMIE